MASELKRIHDCLELCIDSYAPYFRICNDLSASLGEFYDSRGFGLNRIEVSGSFGVFENEFYIIFDGSFDVYDWISNIQFFPDSVTPYDGVSDNIKVHKGILNQYKLIRDFILDQTEIFLKKNDDKYSINIAGHSLGGALAALATLDIQYNFDAQPLCVMAGAPKFGNRKFIESFNSRVYRCFNFINKKDLIPKLPPLMYGHCGDVIKIGKGFGFGLRSHLPTVYLENFEKYLNRI